MEHLTSFQLFLLCFDGVFSTCRNVFPIVFSRVEKLKIAFAASDFLKIYSGLFFLISSRFLFLTNWILRNSCFGVSLQVMSKSSKVFALCGSIFGLAFTGNSIRNFLEVYSFRLYFFFIFRS